MSNLSFEIDEKTGELAMCLSAMCVSVNRESAAVIAKTMAHYAETGKLNKPLKRWAIGWNRDSCMFRLHAWDGIIDITKPHTQPLYFKSETEAHTVRNALYDQQEDPPAVMPVNVVERWSRLVEVDE